jgi:predicted transcriptional regulator
MAGVKEEAAKLVDALAADATWEDLMYEIYVRQAIDAGLADSEAGAVLSVDEVRKEFGLTR